MTEALGKAMGRGGRRSSDQSALGAATGRGGRRASNQSQTIDLILNGKPRSVAAGTAVPGLLAALGVDRRAVAVALNGDVVPRAQWDDVVLAAGDRVEVVRMVGGG